MARARGSSDNDSPPWLEPAALADDGEAAPLSRKWVVGGAAVFVLALVGTVIAVSSGEEQDPYGNAIVAGANGEPPLIVAPKEPFRVEPKDPGGMRADGEGLMIGEVASGQELKSDVRLATGPEQPVERPAPPPVVVGEPSPLLPPEAEAAMAETPTPQAVAKTPESKPETGPAAAKADAGKADAAKAAEAAKAEAARAAEAKAKAEAEKAAAAKAAEAKARAEAEKAAAAKAEAAKKPAYFLQLGAFSSVDRAQTGWRDFAAKYEKELEKLGPDIQPVKTGDKTMYRLRAGPISLKARADSLCGKLKAAGQPCLVAEK